MDDGSTEKIGAICDEYAKKDKIVMFIHRSNQGFWAIRNAGLRVMKGDFVVDGDYYIYLINSVVIAF